MTPGQTDRRDPSQPPGGRRRSGGRSGGRRDGERGDPRGGERGDPWTGRRAGGRADRETDPGSGRRSGPWPQKWLERWRHQGARHWPRERRDTLFLMLPILLSVAPQLPFLPWWIGTTFLALFGWRLALVFSGRWLPRAAVRQAALLACCAGVYAQYGSLFGQEPGTALLVLFLGVKLMEMQARRDLIVVICLCFFLLLTSFFHSGSAAGAFVVLLAVAALLMAMLTLQYTNEEAPLAARLRLAGTLLGQALPLAIVAFVLFPRPAVPLWGIATDGARATTGLSDSMTIGNIRELGESQEIAFRVRFEGPVPPRQLLYWRGPVFDTFDGTSWRSSAQEPPPGFRPDRSAMIEWGNDPRQRYAYTVTLEAARQNWLLALELPRTADAPGERVALRQPGLELVAARAVREGLRYRVISETGFRVDAGRRPEELRAWLALPDEYAPRARALAARWKREETERPGKAAGGIAAADGATVDGATVDGATVDGATVDGATVDGAAVGGAAVGGAAVGRAAVGGAAVGGAAVGRAMTSGMVADRASAGDAGSDGPSDDLALIRRALAFFREEPFRYTLTPPLLGRQAVDDFLFDARAGFCEHYASAFVVLMRALGIPARVITGYQGGEPAAAGQPDADGEWLVRQADAHAWAEVWLRNQGWTRVDPTAAVDPARIEYGRRLRGNATDGALHGPLLTWLRPLNDGFEAIGRAWQRWVLHYDGSRQNSLLARLGIEAPSPMKLAGLLAAMTGALLLAAAALTLRPRLARAPLERCWDIFCARLARVGLERAPHETPAQYLRRIENALPSGPAATAREIITRYEWLNYGASGNGRHAGERKARDGRGICSARRKHGSAAGRRAVRDLRRRIRAFRPAGRGENR